jgi:hypothetical protein
MTTVKKNNRTRDYAAEIAFHYQARAIPPAARPGLLDWLRRAHRRPPPRTFWLLDPDTGKWCQIS